LVSRWESIFTTKLEPILSKIPKKRKIAARFARGTPTPAARRLTAAKARKISFNSFRGRTQKSFSIKE